MATKEEIQKIERNSKRAEHKTDNTEARLRELEAREAELAERERQLKRQHESFHSMQNPHAGKKLLVEVNQRLFTTATPAEVALVVSDCREQLSELFQLAYRAAEEDVDLLMERRWQLVKIIEKVIYGFRDRTGYNWAWYKDGIHGRHEYMVTPKDTFVFTIGCPAEVYHKELPEQDRVIKRYLKTFKIKSSQVLDKSRFDEYINAGKIVASLKM